MDVLLGGGGPQVLEDALLTVGPTGAILDLVDLSTAPDAAARVAAVRPVLRTLGRAELLVPGLVDGHAHAPQYAFVGTGMDLPLLQWLETYTFPAEARFNDLAYAKKVFIPPTPLSFSSSHAFQPWPHAATIAGNPSPPPLRLCLEAGGRAQPHAGTPPLLSRKKEANEPDP